MTSIPQRYPFLNRQRPSTTMECIHDFGLRRKWILHNPGNSRRFHRQRRCCRDRSCGLCSSIAMLAVEDAKAPFYLRHVTRRGGSWFQASRATKACRHCGRSQTLPRSTQHDTIVPAMHRHIEVRIVRTCHLELAMKHIAGARRTAPV
jgi:hypothetical protein